MENVLLKKKKLIFLHTKSFRERPNSKKNKLTQSLQSLLLKGIGMSLKYSNNKKIH